MIMPSSTGFTQRASSIIKFNWIFISAVLLLICCFSIDCRAIDADALSENDLNDNFYPSVMLADDSSFVERAAPRLGRASPRLGRATPRLGRRALALLLSRLNHAGRYYNIDNDAISSDQDDLESAMQEKRASPRLGRALK